MTSPISSCLNLNGEWQLTSPQRPDLRLPMTVPGDNASALLAAGVIANPYYGENEQRSRWIEQCEWHIESHFEVDETLLEQRQIWLTLTRVDTLATWYLNDVAILSCSNMFTQYQVDIRPHLRLGDNVLRVEFARVDLAANAKAAELPFPIPSAMGNNQLPHMNLIRKTQCHSGWDWGICLMVSGIYDPIRVQAVNDYWLKSLSAEQAWQADGSVKVSALVEIDCAYPASEQTVEITFAEQTQTLSLDGAGIYRAEFVIGSPRRWWPAGYGEPHLYSLSATLGEQQLSRQIGLRELALDTSADVSEGQNSGERSGSAMTFVVNGVPITAKGANWIPLDAMPSRESEARYRDRLQSAVDANMNMIRVWGGGQYESDAFYQLCDELGLLVWQDMMFACSLYPSDQAFLAEVEQELRYQIPRLRAHACIALWCGDNEVIGAIGWYDESKHNKVKYTVNYDRLNRLIEQVIGQEDRSRAFWPSSPCNGELDFGDAWHDDNRGDMHFWDVWHSGKPFSAYLDIKPRFCSEFGFQSWPSLAEVKQFVPEQDWNITSPTFESHQKNPRGNSIITEMFTRYFRFPSGFEQMLYLSQVQQALAIKTACEHWRAISPVCRGMLYWQLNDNWPVSSWSSLEYSGRWKQLHYHAKRFFAPQCAVFSQHSGELAIHLINDSREAQIVTGKVYWVNWQGDIMRRWAISTEVQPDSNNRVWLCDPSLTHSAMNQGFLYVTGQCRDNQGNVSEFTNTGFASLELKQYPIRQAKIDIEVRGNQITLTSDKPAFFVHLECDTTGRFSDSSITLLADEPVTIEFLGEDVAAMANTLRVYQLGS